MRLKRNLTNGSIPNSEFLSEGPAAVRCERFLSDRNSELRIKYWSDPLLIINALERESVRSLFTRIRINIDLRTLAKRLHRSGVLSDVRVVRRGSSPSTDNRVFPSIRSHSRPPKPTRPNFSPN